MDNRPDFRKRSRAVHLGLHALAANRALLSVQTNDPAALAGDLHASRQASSGGTADLPTSQNPEM